MHFYRYWDSLKFCNSHHFQWRDLCSLGFSLPQQQDLCEITVKQITEQVLLDSHMLVFSVLLEGNHCVLHLQLPATSSNNLSYYYSSGNSCRTPCQTAPPHAYKHTLKIGCQHCFFRILQNFAWEMKCCISTNSMCLQSEVLENRKAWMQNSINT